MSQKEKLIQELQLAFLKGDIQTIIESMADDVAWEMVGGKVHKGKAEIEKELASMDNFEMLENKLDKVVTHGKLASANGTFRMKEKGVEKSYGFCDIYEFSGFKNAKIKKMISYVVPIK